MAIDSRKRQKKLEQRKAKEKKRKAAARRGPSYLTARIERAADAPILHCCTSDTLWNQGMANVLISRELNSGNVAFAMFLVDMYCLGVKDVAFDIVSRGRYDWPIYDKVCRDGDQRVNLEPEEVVKLVDGAVEYASQLGLSPHRDFHKARLVFGELDAGACREEFVYGKNGQPMFIAGPDDSRSQCDRIIQILTDRCGPDGFHYITPIAEIEILASGSKFEPIDEADEFEEEWD